MINTEYSLQAQNIHIDIQNINESLQINIDNFYNSIEGLTDIYSQTLDSRYENTYKILKSKIVSSIESLNDISIAYFLSCKDEFENYDIHSKFKLSSNLEELLSDYFDTINANLTVSDLSKVNDEILVKYIHMSSVYENIMDGLIDLNMFGEYYEKRYYSSDNIVTIIDFLINGFYECIDNLKIIYTSENSFSGMIQCYIVNLKIVLYIIEFIESIKSISY